MRGVPQQHVNVLKPRVHADAHAWPKTAAAQQHQQTVEISLRRLQRPTSDTSRDQSVSAARTSDLGHVEKVRSGLLLVILHVPSKAASAAGHPKTTPQREAAPWCFRKSPDDDDDNDDDDDDDDDDVWVGGCVGGWVGLFLFLRGEC